MSQIWSQAAVIHRIKELHLIGARLNSDHIQKTYSPLYNAACNYCGNWRKAILASGLSYDEVRIKKANRKVIWTREIVVETIRTHHKEGKPLNSNHAQTKEARLYGAACKYFGSWPNAINATQLDYEQLRRKVPMRSWSQSVIVERIIQRHLEGKSIRGSTVYDEEPNLYLAAKRHFGSSGWAKARTLAGFDPIDPSSLIIWNRINICEVILELQESGVALHCGAMQKSSYSHILSAAQKVYGTWAEAITATGLDYEAIRKKKPSGWWTPDRIILCIQSLEKQGTRLSSKAMNLTQGALFSQAVKQFGSWGQAVQAAGLNYRKHSHNWTTKSFLRSVDEGQYRELIESARVNTQLRRTRHDRQ